MLFVVDGGVGVHRVDGVFSFLRIFCKPQPHCDKKTPVRPLSWSCFLARGLWRRRAWRMTAITMTRATRRKREDVFCCWVRCGCYVVVIAVVVAVVEASTTVAVPRTAIIW